MAQNGKGALLALLAFGIYATSDALVKHLGEDYSPFQLIFFSTLFSFPLAMGMMMRDPRARDAAPRPSLVDRAPLGRHGALRALGLLRLLGAAAGAGLRHRLRAAAPHHAPRHPRPGRAGAASAAASPWWRGSRA